MAWVTGRQFSAEMKKYGDSGCCPRCGVRILSEPVPEWALRVLRLPVHATQHARHFEGKKERARIDGVIAEDNRARMTIAPFGARISHDGGDHLKCESCGGQWAIYQTLADQL